MCTFICRRRINNILTSEVFSVNKFWFDVPMGDINKLMAKKHNVHGHFNKLLANICVPLA